MTTEEQSIHEDIQSHWNADLFVAARSANSRARNFLQCKPSGDLILRLSWCWIDGFASLVH